MAKPKFIVLEGGEGAGKSTQLKLFKESFGDSVVVTREPGGSPYAEEIRNVILKSSNAKDANAKTHFALFWAARADHIANTILPALKAGKPVISDRFDSSTFAYQIYGQEAKKLEDFFWKTREFYMEELKPDLYIYLDVDIEVGLRRKYADNQEINHFEERDLAFHRRMKTGFTEFFKHVPYKIIDANQPLEKVKEDLLGIIKNELGF